MMLVDTNLAREYLQADSRRRNPKAWEFVERLRETEGITIAFVTQYELRRGVEKLLLRGEGRKKLVALRKFLDGVGVLGLDMARGKGWDFAARLWARGQAHSESIVLSEGDLLIAATALYHERTLATADASLATQLERMGFGGEVELVRG